MGVSGLWDVLRPTGQVRALTHLAVEDGFVANTNGHRAYRIGIDASIWFFHAQGGREGENPELRTLFFRCARLLAMPYLPIFVFDGPGRPKIKRGKAVGGSEHWLVNSLRSVLDAFGFECRTAPGEAEAELAFLNRIGAIDAILSDDVDCFIFGAQTVMRNGSVTLSGNRAHGTGDAHHVYVYNAQDIIAHPRVGLSQGGMILIALLSGGDYSKGIEGCGVSTAHALARVGFGDTLLSAARESPAALATLLPTWRAALCEELKTNASGLAPRRCPSVAQRITNAFPSLEVLRCYTHPLTSERASGAGLELAAYGLGDLWQKRVDVGKVAHVCERYFEWGIEEAVVKRFRTLLWPGAVMRTLLQAALERDGHASPARGRGLDTPSKVLARSLGGMALNESLEFDDESSSDIDGPKYHSRIDATALIKTIHSTRKHDSTDRLLEYRVEVRPRALVACTRAGMQGIRTVTQDSAKDPGEDDDNDDEDEKTGGRAPPDPDSTLRIWMPASVVEFACPRIVARFEEKQAKKAAKKAGKGKGKGRARPKKVNDSEEESDSASPVKTKAKRAAQSKSKAMTFPLEDEEEESEPLKSKKPLTKPPPTKGRRKIERQLQEAVRFSGRGVSWLQDPAQSMSHVLRKTTSSKSFVELLDEDPFLVSAGLSPIHRNIRPEQPVLSTSSKPHPFPMSLDPDSDGGDNDSFIVAPLSGLVRGRKHSADASSSDPDSPLARVKKSPRKSTEHASPRKHGTYGAPPARSPSPSPMRPLQRARMKPLQMARAAVSKIHDDDVIVISSDSDVPAPPLRARTNVPEAGSRRRDSALASFSPHQEVIDLT